MAIENILGPSWMPKLGAICCAAGIGVGHHASVSVSGWGEPLNLIGLALLGASRQNNVSSEQAGAVKSDPAAAAVVKAGVLMIASVLLFSGCGTVGKLATTKNIATVAELAAYEGAKYEIEHKPESRVYFVAGRDALRGLLSSTNYSPVEFSQAIHKLPVKELRGSEASLIFDAAVVLWEPYASKITELDKEEKVKPIIQAVETGLTKAIDATEPTP